MFKKQLYIDKLLMGYEIYVYGGGSNERDNPYPSWME